MAMTDFFDSYPEPAWEPGEDGPQELADMLGPDKVRAVIADAVKRHFTSEDLWQARRRAFIAKLDRLDRLIAIDAAHYGITL